LVSESGSFKLGDFGIARKLDSSGGNMTMTSVGTPNYVAPEVLSGVYDERADIYSLGLVLYQLLNRGCLPFVDPTSISQNTKNPQVRRLEGEAFNSPVEASPEMAHVIMRACQHKPEQRFKTAIEFKEALEAVKNRTYVLPGDGTGFLHDDIDLEPELESLPVEPEPEPESLPLEPLPIQPRKMTIYRKVAIIAGVAFVCWLLAGIIILLAGTANRDPAGTTSYTNGDDIGTDSDVSIEQSYNYDSNAELSPVIGEQQAIYGNTPGNIINVGIVAKQGDWIYYSRDGIYCIKVDGSELIKLDTLLNRDRAYNISVVNDRLYYIATDYVATGITYNDAIISMRINGSDRQRLNDDSARYINVVDDMIYYRNNSDGGNIYSMRIDGTDRQKLNDDDSMFVNVVNGRVYYSNLSDRVIFTVSVWMAVIDVY
jgi:serine/threonine protein kinase